MTYTSKDVLMAFNGQKVEGLFLKRIPYEAFCKMWAANAGHDLPCPAFKQTPGVYFKKAFYLGCPAIIREVCDSQKFMHHVVYVDEAEKMTVPETKSLVSIAYPILRQIAVEIGIYVVTFGYTLARTNNPGDYWTPGDSYIDIRLRVVGYCVVTNEGESPDYRPTAAVEDYFIRECWPVIEDFCREQSITTRQWPNKNY
jgi:hypothetical protein